MFRSCTGKWTCISVGMLRNTEPLNANKVSHYELEVKAEDCGGRVSDDATISIEVTPVCKRGLTGRAINILHFA